MEMNPNQLLREIEEDLRYDRLEKLWKNYGGYMVALAIGIVLATGASVAWKTWKNAQYGKATTELVDILQQGISKQNPLQARAEALESYARKAPQGQTVLALFFKAQDLLQAGDIAGAVQSYESIAKKAPQPYADLATIMAVWNQLDTADPKTLVERLEPLTKPKNPWHFSALEMQGLLSAKMGDKSKAADIFHKLALEEGAPLSLKERAFRLAIFYGETP